jgi:hypothetical protein
MLRINSAAQLAADKAAAILSSRIMVQMKLSASLAPHLQL